MLNGGAEAQNSLPKEKVENIMHPAEERKATFFAQLSQSYHISCVCFFLSEILLRHLEKPWNYSRISGFIVE